MKRLALLLVPTVILVACLSVRTPSPGYYISQPATFAAPDSVIERVLVYFDERTLIWLNALLDANRRNLQEWGACLHIARQLGPDGFKVDSVFAATINNPPPTWRSARFTCPDSAAPIHWHIVTTELGGWLQAQHDTIALPERCSPSETDAGPQWARFPFNAMQCGRGIDSIIAYRVRPRGP